MPFGRRRRPCLREREGPKAGAKRLRVGGIAPQVRTGPKGIGHPGGKRCPIRSGMTSTKEMPDQVGHDVNGGGRIIELGRWSSQKLLR